MTKKILIIDDEEGIRESLKLILERDYDLIDCEDPEQGLEILKNDKSINLVLLDIKMPKIHGLEMLETIKREHAGTPVIMVTGYNSVEMANEAAQLGANSYICKPFHTETILQTVARVIG